MKINKIRDDIGFAISGIANGATLLIGGFGDAGTPYDLIDAVLKQGATDLTLVSNNVGGQGRGVDALLAAGRVRRVICSFPKQPQGGVFSDLYQKGEVELELTPQGTLAERIRAGGAGIGGFYTPTGVTTDLGGIRKKGGREIREIDGKLYLFEEPIRGDFALIRGARADRWGNVTYRKSSRNFSSIMATAARVTIVSVDAIQSSPLDPEMIVTPGIFIDHVVYKS